MAMSAKEQGAERKRKLAFQEKKKAIREAILNEEKITVQFNNNEFPGQSLTFNYEGINYFLESGKRYDLPISVVDHLNSIMIPDPHYEQDPVTGQMQLVADSTRSRFTVHPVTPMRLRQERAAAAAGGTTGA